MYDTLIIMVIIHVDKQVDEAVNFVVVKTSCESVLKMSCSDVPNRIFSELFILG